MLKKAFASWRLSSVREKIFFLLAIGVGFLIAMDYAIVRPVSQSLFLQMYGSSSLPMVWLWSLPLNVFCVWGYNRLLPRMGCFRLFCLSALCVIGVNVLAASLIDVYPMSSFALYIWKEIYIMLMLQQLWSIIHATASLHSARYMYGILFGFGSLGGAVGSLVPGLFAVQTGSVKLLFCTIPIYLVLMVGYFFLLQYSHVSQQEEQAPEQKQHASLRAGIKLIRASPLLLAIVAMTLFMQSTSCLTDFQFQHYLERVYPELDVRTAFFGKMLCIGNLLTMGFQFVGTFMLVQYWGLQRTHLVVPVALLLLSSGFFLFPSFGWVASIFVCGKCLDFSVFCVVKEMLYIPLRLEEKFQAKACIDVFMHRAAKVGASFALLLLQVLCTERLLYSITIINIVLCALWVWVIYGLSQNYRMAERHS